jgi:hypothetical protein
VVHLVVHMSGLSVKALTNNAKSVGLQAYHVLMNKFFFCCILSYLCKSINKHTYASLVCWSKDLLLHNVYFDYFCFLRVVAEFSTKSA